MQERSRLSIRTVSTERKTGRKCWESETPLRAGLGGPGTAKDWRLCFGLGKGSSSSGGRSPESPICPAAACANHCPG